ncbi:MAG: hypothetical protein EBX36_08690, partial [Planctomycetia bacterium]|nr:hypothetical protein [Planctomycetia bacterium]
AAAIYTTWAAAWAAASAMDGLVTLWVDSPTAFVVVPAGVYDFANVLLCGYPTLDTTVATIQTPANILLTFNGVTFQNLTYASNVGFAHTGGLPLIDYTMAPGSSGTRVILNRVSLVAGDAGPVLRFQGAAVAWLQIESGSTIALAPNPAVEVDVGATLVLTVSSSFIADDSVTGAGSLNLTCIASALPNTMAGMGTYLPTNTAQLTAYSPGNVADWVASPPSTVAQALDRIVAAVAGLLGGPVP